MSKKLGDGESEVEGLEERWSPLEGVFQAYFLDIKIIGQKKLKQPSKNQKPSTSAGFSWW